MRARALLSASSTDAAFVVVLRDAVDRMALDDAARIDVDGAWSRFRVLRSAPTPVRMQAARPASWRSRMVVPSLLAAAALLVVALATYRRALPDESTARTWATGVGQRDSVTLTDGSHATLEPGTTLHVREAFNVRQRDVDLQGSAFFAVAHDTRRPFVIHAGEATVRVVGTSFRVRTSPADSSVEVSVETGLVRVGAARGDTVMLRAGDIGRVTRGGAIMLQRASGSADSAARARGWEVLRDATLPEVASALRRWYGLSLHTSDSVLATRRLSATLGDAPVDRVVELLELSLGARATRRGDTLVLEADPTRRATR